MGYKLKVKKISIVNEAGDRVAVFNCYLVDSSNIAFKPVGSSEIGFDIRVPKSSVPGSGLSDYLTNLAKDQIAKKFNRTLTVTASPINGSNKLLFLSTDVEQLFVGLTVTGPGITTTPATALTSITTPTEVQLSQNLTMQISGTTVAPSCTYTGTTAISVTFTYAGTLAIGSNNVTAMVSTSNIVSGMSVSGTGIPSGTTVATISTNSITLSQTATVAGSQTLTFNSNPTIITGMSGTTNLTGGMTVSGTGIPYGSTILSIISSTSISITQNATVSGTNSFTFSTNPNSAYLSTGSSYFTSAFEGMGITGTNIPLNTTILSYVSATQIKLSNNATGAGTNTHTIAGTPDYYFDTSYTCTGTGTTTTSNPVITMLTTSNLATGMYVSGTGIPSGSKILSIIPSTSITISQNATAAGSVSLTFSNMYVDYSELSNQTIVNFNYL